MAEGNGLLNRRMGINPYRGFESRPLRSTLRYSRKGRLTAERQAIFLIMYLSSSLFCFFIDD